MYRHLKNTFCQGLIARNALIVLASLLLLGGCGRTIFVPGGQPALPPVQGGHVAGQSLAAQADAAWQSGNLGEAERLYKAIGRDIAASKADRALAWERVARIAMKANDTQGAHYALNAWKGLVPGVEALPHGRKCRV